MPFGPESTNPRERRAYAHAIIKKFHDGTATYADAYSASQSANQTVKGERSGFDAAIGPIFIEGVCFDYANDRTVLSGISRGLKKTIDALDRGAHIYSVQMNAHLERPGTTKDEQVEPGQVVDPLELGFSPMTLNPNHRLRPYNPVVSEPTHTNNNGVTFYEATPVRPDHLA